MIVGHGFTMTEIGLSVKSHRGFGFALFLHVFLEQRLFGRGSNIDMLVGLAALAADRLLPVKMAETHEVSTAKTPP